MGIISRLVTYARRQRDPVRWARSIGVTIGDDCRLLDVSFSTEPYLVTLGDHVSATSTTFLTHDGGVWVTRANHPDIDVFGRIIVGSNVYFGFGCIVMPGVTIGDDVIVGAGSIVTKDVPSGMVVAGVPARVIKTTGDYVDKVLSISFPTKNMPQAEKERYIRERLLDGA